MQTNPASWMATPSIQSKNVGDIILPGTHDSGTYSLTLQLSEIMYSNIAILWDLQQTNAPVNGNYPWTDINPTTQQPNIYIGPNVAAYNVPMQIALNSAQSQGYSIAEQLSMGIRYFDLRIYWDSAHQGYFVQHALMGCSFADILSQLAAFLSTGEELVFIDLSHTNFTAADTQNIANMINQTIQPTNIYSNLTTTADIYNVPLSSITNGSSKLITLNGDNISYPSPVVNCDFINSGRFVSNPNGTDNLQSMTEAEQTGLKTNYDGKNLYQVQWNLTPQVQDIINGAVTYLTTFADTSIILPLAQEANPTIGSFISNNSQYNINVVSTDWFDQGNFVAQILAANGLD